MSSRTRGRLRGAAVALALGAAVAVAGSVAVQPVAPAIVTVDAVSVRVGEPVRIHYRVAAETFGDLYLPSHGSGPYPVVVLIHGGGWAQSRDLTQFDRQSKVLAEQGVAVWNVEYRRVNGAGGWPTTLTDVDDAVGALGTVVQWRSGNRLDLGRVHLAGHSAGGHLAAWVAGRPARTDGIRIRSLTVMAAVLDPQLAATAGHDVFVQRLLGGTPAEVPDRYRFASPIDHLPAGLTITALHGDRDHVVAVDQSRRYIAAASASNATDLRILPGIGHAEFVDPASSAWAATESAILDHVARLS
ncbi:alpha/beta hydrolase family protein [Nocardia sp. NPDC051570]|uniref:alpha/beta hydrolase family protein n=1 Tax=Nocardia sp. NPDC051570 TaxID=3364324 RepID=UPI00378C552D